MEKEDRPTKLTNLTMEAIDISVQEMITNSKVGLAIEILDRYLSVNI